LTIRRQRDDHTHGKLDDCGLTGELAVEGQIAGITELERVETIAGVAAQGPRDRIIRRAVEQDGNEPLVGLFLVEVAVEDTSLPVDAASLVRGRSPFDSLPVDIRANDEDEGRLLRAKLLFAPARPPLGRADMVLVQLHVHALAAEGVGQFEHLLGVGCGVVAVTDEGGCPAHVTKTRVASSTAAKHGKEKSRVGAETQSPEALFHGAIVGVLLGGSEG
jgi:hypothetical protein